MNKYVLISGFNINDSNRGTAALSYGSISFLNKINLLKEQELTNFRITKNPLKKANRGKKVEYINIEGKTWTHKIYNINFAELLLFEKFNILLPFSNFKKIIKKIDFVAAINGGDGFSDIYDTNSFLYRLTDSNLAIQLKKDLIILPQTLGPFKDENNLAIAKRILSYAKLIFVRDDKFISQLKTWGLDYEQTNDLSYFMKPEPFNINIKERSIGLNISGLAYSNKFRTLSNQFENYPYLINQIITFFQKENCPIYLISHSYNYNNPELNNDDLIAAKEVYASLRDKKNVILVDENLNSPQTKYLISKMSFFIGTRMHANFAAIFTNVPVFGLAYSYKFQGAFERNGIHNSVAIINNINKDEANSIVDLIIQKYNNTQKKH